MYFFLLIYIFSAFLFIFTFGGDAGGGVTGKVELRDRCLTNNIFASNGENPFFGKKLTKRSSRLC